jgi:hypothetical protein
MILADAFHSDLVRPRDRVSQSRDLACHRLGIGLIVPNSNRAALYGYVHLRDAGLPTTVANVSGRALPMCNL